MELRAESRILYSEFTSERGRLHGLLPVEGAT